MKAKMTRTCEEGEEDTGNEKDGEEELVNPKEPQHSSQRDKDQTVTTHELTKNLPSTSLSLEFFFFFSLGGAINNEVVLCASYNQNILGSEEMKGEEQLLLGREKQQRHRHSRACF